MSQSRPAVPSDRDAPLGEQSDTRTIGALVADAARRGGDRDALLAPDRPALTFAGLGAVVEAIGATLRAAGIRTDDRVALITANGPEAVTAFLGIASIAAAAPLNPAYRREEIAFDLTDLRARAIVVDDTLDTPAADVARELGIPVVMLRRVDGAPAGTIHLDVEALRAAGSGVGGAHGSLTPTADDVALVLHTSGTTARPKIVPLRHGRLVASARTIGATLGLTEADRCLNVMPLFHIHGLVAGVLATLRSGGSVVAAPGFVAPSFFAWLDAFAPSWYTAVPTIHQAVLARSRDQADVIARRPLRFIRSSSASLPVHVLEGLEAAFGAPVIEAYGMTEASHQMASNPLPPAEHRPGSVGRATGIEIAVLDGDGRPLPTGSVGEVAIRGATVFDGYEANPEANATAFVDGWFLTGDEGSLDEDGYLTLRGRRKELINRGGEKIAPVEVEEALLAVPGVAQAVAFSMPDPRLGEEVAAAVVPAPGAQLRERELQAVIAGRLADFKVPRTIRIVDEIPKGATGKIQRIGMAQRLGIAGTSTEAASAVGERAATYVEPHSPTERELASIWGEVLGIERVGVTDDYFQLGGDSILAAMIVTRIGDRLGHRDLPLATFLWAPTIERYARGLEDGTWESAASPLVAIQPQGSRPPFFFVFIDDAISSLASMGRAIDPDQPLYGLRAMAGDGSYLPPSIDALAKAFLDEVRTVQPDGPYSLGGFCTGGRVAMEMARRLDAAGEEVRVLTLVDPRVDQRRGIHWYAGRPAYFAKRARHHLRDGRLAAAAVGILRSVVIRFTAAPTDRPLDHDRYLEVLAGTRRGKKLEPVPAPLVVFGSRQYDVPRDLWNRLSGDLTWERLPVDHETMFLGDQGAIVAAHLSESLRVAAADA